MSDVTATTAPAAAAPANTPAAPAVEPVSDKQPEVDKAYNAAQMAARIARETNEALKALTQKVEAIQAKPAASDAKMPQGVEAELKELRAELDRQRQVAAQEKLDAEIMRSATALGVDPHRIKYLKMELRESHGQNLTHEGTPDPMDSSKRISVETIIAGILKSPAGAMFKAAPSAASLPNAGQNTSASVAKKTMKLSEFNKIARGGGDTYRNVYASVKIGETVIVDD